MLETKSEASTKKFGKIRPGAIIAIVLVVGLAGLCIWQFSEMQKLRNPDYAGEQARVEAQELKDKVAKLMQLPDEDATVATVQDASKLSEQDFFKDSENGDKVLIFTAAKKAVIYRPSENKIINSGPIVISSVSSEGITDTE